MCAACLVKSLNTSEAGFLLKLSKTKDLFFEEHTLHSPSPRIIFLKGTQPQLCSMQNLFTL